MLGCGMEAGKAAATAAAAARAAGRASGRGPRGRGEPASVVLRGAWSGSGPTGQRLCLHHVPGWLAGLGSWDGAWCGTQSDQGGWGPAGLRGPSSAEQAVCCSWHPLPLGVPQAPQSWGQWEAGGPGSLGTPRVAGDSRLSPASGAGPCSVSEAARSPPSLVAACLAVGAPSPVPGPPWAPLFPAADRQNAARPGSQAPPEGRRWRSWARTRTDLCPRLARPRPRRLQLRSLHVAPVSTGGPARTQMDKSKRGRYSSFVI